MADNLWLGNDSGNEGDVNVAANWSINVPIAGENLYFRESSQSLTSNLNALTGIDFDDVHFEQSFTGSINDGSDSYFLFECDNLYIGAHDGAGTPGGSGKLLLNIEAKAASVYIYNTGTSSDANNPAVRLLCNNAADVVHVIKGSVGIAKKYGETATLATLNIGYDKNQRADANVVLGSGVTVTTILKTGSMLTTRAGATTLTHHAGELITEGAGAITNLYSVGGSLTLNSSGTIGTLTILGGTEVDFTRSTVAKTVTNCTNYGGKIRYDDAIVTFTNAPASDQVITLTV